MTQQDQPMNQSRSAQKLIQETWQAAFLEQCLSLEEDWITNRKVLVGITLTTSPI